MNIVQEMSVKKIAECAEKVLQPCTKLIDDACCLWQHVPTIVASEKDGEEVFLYAMLEMLAVQLKSQKIYRGNRSILLISDYFFYISLYNSNFLLYLQYNFLKKYLLYTLW